MIVNFPPQLWSARPQLCLDFHSYGADIHNCGSLTTVMDLADTTVEGFPRLWTLQP